MNLFKAFKEIFSFSKRFFVSFAIKLKYSFSLFISGSYIPFSVSIHSSEKSKLILGKGSRIGKNSIISFLKMSELLIGDNTFIGHYANIRVSKKIIIGKDCRIAQFVSFIGDNHNFDRTDIPGYLQGVIPENIIIEDDVWIGTQVVILTGITIGKSSIIGAGSIVTKSVPPYSICVGNPAKIIKNRKD